MTWEEVMFYAEYIPPERMTGIVVDKESKPGSANLGKLKLGKITRGR